MNARRIAGRTAVAMLISAVTPLALAQDARPQHGGGNPEATSALVRDVRQATGKFQDVNAATAEGYVSDGSCASGPNGGAMGVHYLNHAFISDGVLDARRPEVLVY